MTTTAGAYEQLRADILDGRHPAGTRLAPGELAAGLGCPPAHVGEALALLAADGLVDGGDGDPRVVVWSREDLREVFRLRAVLEGFAASLAAEAMKTADILALHELADTMEELAGDGGPREELARLDLAFHHLVLVGSGSRRLPGTHDHVLVTPLHHRVFRAYSPVQLAQALAHHREVARAIELRAPDWADAAMRSHVLSGLHILLSHDPY